MRPQHKPFRRDPSQWYFVLKGERNLGYKKAKIAAQVLNTETDLWINPEASANDRREAWGKFTGRAK